METNSPAVDDVMETSSQAVDDAGMIVDINELTFNNPCLELILKVITNDIDGKTINASFTQTKRLLDSQRHLLARIIAKYAYDKWGKKVTKEQFQGLADSVELCFEGEVSSTYYVPYSNVKKSVASGKIWHAFNTYKKKLKKEKSVNPVANDANNVVVVVDNNLLPNELQEKLLFLKNNVDPWEKIESIWDETFEHRRNFLNSDTDIQNYLEEFACVKYPLKGFQLLERDFSRLYPQCQSDLLTLWPLFRTKLITLVSELEFSEKPAVVVSQLNDLEPKYKDVPLLYLLTYILPSLYMPAVKPGVRRQRASQKEVEEALYFHIVNPAEMQAKVQKKKEDCKKENYTFQPILIFVGSLTKIESSYVLINDVLHTCDSPIHAIQLCFIAFWSLDAKYPIAANQIWVLLQQAIYNLETSLDKTTTKIRSLIKRLNVATSANVSIAAA